MDQADLGEEYRFKNGKKVIPIRFPQKRLSRRELSIEITRKSIHLLIGFVPLLLSISRPMTLALLGSGCIAYALFETLRMKGISVPLISALTMKAARMRDSGKFVGGPITLGLGAFLSVLLFAPVPASIAVYVLAFGDGLSSLVGKLFGKIRLPRTGGKSLEGSITCFTVSLISAYMMSARLGPSLVIAAVSTITEVLPTKDWDNILLPLTVGAAAAILGL